MNEYNVMELMIVLAARHLKDGVSVVVGTGGPCAAVMLAQKTSAPNLLILFEAGGVGPQLPSMPISVGDSRTFYRGIMASTMLDVMDACQRGIIDYAFLGGAQIDVYGNLNSTQIGKDHSHPKVRFPGSGGANDLASLCWRTIIMILHNKRRFVEKVDFVTTPGYLTGKGSREEAGLPKDTGPYKVITNLAVLGFDELTCRMCIELVHPGVNVKKVQENTGFELLKKSPVEVTKPPTEEELRILREEVDPGRYLIGKDPA